MSIKLRFALLLGLLLLIFLGSLGVLRLLEKEQLTEALASSQHDASEMLERWLDLNGASLRQFAEDYSRWDDMVDFMDNPDPDWAQVNLKQSLDSFNAHALWVLSVDGTLIYQAHDGEATPPPVSREEWKTLTDGNPFPHFYIEHDHDILEVRAAPIQPSGDTTRSPPPERLAGGFPHLESRPPESPGQSHREHPHA